MVRRLAGAAGAAGSLVATVANLGCCGVALVGPAAALGGLAGLLAPIGARWGYEALYASLAVTLLALGVNARRRGRVGPLAIAAAGSAALLLAFHEAWDVGTFAVLVAGGSLALVGGAVADVGRDGSVKDVAYGPKGWDGPEARAVIKSLLRIVKGGKRMATTLEKIDPALGLMKEFSRRTLGTASAIQRLRQEVIFTDGKVPAKYKTLAAALWAVSARCEPCIKFYVQEARKLGVTEEELGEFLAVGSTMGGCVGEMWALKAFAAYRDAAAEPSCCAPEPA